MGLPAEPALSGRQCRAPPIVLPPKTVKLQGDTAIALDLQRDVADPVWLWQRHARKQLILLSSERVVECGGLSRPESVKVMLRSRGRRLRLGPRRPGRLLECCPARLRHLPGTGEVPLSTANEHLVLLRRTSTAKVCN